MTWTSSPFCRPPVISESVPKTWPTVTSVVTGWPPTSLRTTVFPFSVRIAAVGTVRMSSYCRTTIDTLAEPPAYRPAGLPVTATVTGKVAAPPLLLAAITPTWATVPAAFCELPAGVISTG
ncbi:hypothetical protein CGZ94_11350 [Enemella evansiae]|uniref:Uncharacterized protein n=1 Tax=Enemella evansiae TaxID=2016499 RepID=A0A255GKP4_9ACTN|nr:hypothetical protein CGZ94_11350 [Enemella evansiae]